MPRKKCGQNGRKITMVSQEKNFLSHFPKFNYISIVVFGITIKQRIEWYFLHNFKPIAGLTLFVAFLKRAHFFPYWLADSSDWCLRCQNYIRNADHFGIIFTSLNYVILTSQADISRTNHWHHMMWHHMITIWWCQSDVFWSTEYV